MQTTLLKNLKNVIHGVIREVSLVIAGANPEAYIDNLAFEHGDGDVVTDETEAIISAGAFSDDSIEIPEDELSHAEDKKKTEDEETLGEVFETLNEKQKTVVYAMIAGALETAESKEDDNEDDNEDDTKPNGKIKHSNNGGEKIMKKNVFDKSTENEETLEHDALNREELRMIFAEARQSQSTLKNAFLAHGYDNIADAYLAYEDHATTLKHTGETPTMVSITSVIYSQMQEQLPNSPFLKETLNGFPKFLVLLNMFRGFLRIKRRIADITG